MHPQTTSCDAEHKFGVAVQWTCYNSMFLVYCMQAHNLQPTHHTKHTGRPHFVQSHQESNLKLPAILLIMVMSIV